MKKLRAGRVCLTFGIQLVLFCLALTGRSRAQTGSPVYITRPVTVASGMITLTGPTTVTIAGQPITVTQAGAVTVVQSGPLTVVQSGPLTIAQPVTVLFSATPTIKTLIVDSIVNSATANIAPLQSGGIPQTIAGADAVITWNFPAYYNNANVMTALNVPSSSTISLGDVNRYATDSIIRLRHGSGSNVQWSDIANATFSNGTTGIGAVGEPSYNFTPVTFTSTGSVTWGQFLPQQTEGMLQITTTGTITSASVTVQGSVDGTNFAPLGTTNFTLATFSGTQLLTWGNLASNYIRALVTITTLGGTNIIINPTIGHP